MESSRSNHPDGDLTQKRRRHSADNDHAGTDLLSALPDELLIAILDRVDSRTAVSTSALSRRWRRLNPAGSLSAFEFSVTTHLPPEYAGALDLFLDSRARFTGSGDGDELPAVADQIGHYEDRAMKAYVRRLASFLRSPERYARARSLRLEFFITRPEAVAGPETAACVYSAYRWPGLQRLAVHAMPRAAAGRRQRPHFFPVPHPSPALVDLHVTNCTFRSLDGHTHGAAFPALSRLAIEVTPRVALRVWKRYFDYLMRACPRLESLRLVSCFLSGEDDDEGNWFTVDLPPASRLQEMVIETCKYEELNLVNAPRLERLVLERCSTLCLIKTENAPRLETLVCRGSVPELRRSGKANLRVVKLSVLVPSNGEFRLASFFKGIPNVEDLTLLFRGRMIWVEPEHSKCRFQNLEKLLINVPRLWSLQWMKHILKIAPCLEKLQIHIFAPSSDTLLELEDTTPSVESTDSFQRTSCVDTTDNSHQHTYLKEMEMVGFDGAQQQMALVRFFMSSCSALKTVILIRHRALLEGELDRQGGIACPSWLMEDEKAEIVSELRHEIHSDAEIVLG